MPTFETLECRQFLSSVTLTNGVLTLAGNTTTANSLWVKAGNGLLTANSDGQILNTTTSAVQSIVITGGSGNDYIYIDPTVTVPETVSDGDGSDIVQIGGNNDTVTLGNGNSAVWAAGSITVGNGNNSVYAGSGNTSIVAGNGNNILVGGAGNDTIVAGSGYDTIYGGGGANLLEGGANSIYPNRSIENDTIDPSSSQSTPTGIGFYSGNSAPAAQDQNLWDPNITAAGGVNLGVKFQSNVAGTVTGVRFFKGSLDTGVQTGELWTSTGTLLADATFSNETASGWQEVSFSNPVAISANTTYVVSYHTTSAYIAYTPSAMSGGLANGSLTAIPGNASGGNGVYSYNAQTSFPALYNGQTPSYWVDVVFNTGGATTSPSAPASPPPPTAPSVPISVSGAENTTVTGSNGGNSQAPTPIVTLYGTSGETEHSVFVDATSSVLGSGTALTATYSWNFGDPGSQYNTLPGWNAAHIYDNAGTYTITLTITNNIGLTSTLTTQISVAASTRQTIYVDTSGSDSNSGASPTQAIQSITELDTLLAANPNNVTVLFKDGDTFDSPGYINVTGTDEVFGSYGTGAAPVLYKVAGWSDGIFSCSSTASQIVIEDLTFDSQYAAPINDAPDITDTAIFPAGYNITVRNDTFLNVENAVDAYRLPTGVLMEDNSAPLLTGLRGYFDWIDGTEHVLLGNTVVNSTRQHVVRANASDVTSVLIAGNNFTNDDNPADPGETPKCTINLRSGSFFYITDNTLTDGAVSFGPDETMPTTATVNWIKLDGNIINNAQTKLGGSVEHVLISNNLVSVEAYPEIYVQPTDDMGRQMSDVTIENNTGTLSGPNGVFLWVEGNSPAGVITVENNLFAAPSLEQGINFATSVYVDAANADAVTLFSHNVWAAPLQVSMAIPVGAVNYIAPAGVLEETLYLNAAQWNALPNVQDDQFEQVTVTGTTNLQVPVDGEMAGAVLPAPLS